MRALWLLAAVALVACGKNKKDDTDSDPWTSGSGGTGHNTTDSGDSGTNVQTNTRYVGMAAIDLTAPTWTGTETVVVEDIGGAVLCEWTWAAKDWANDTSVNGNPEPAVAECTDGEGNPCTFAFTVNLSNGLQTSGNCGTFYGNEGGYYHYAYVGDWMNAGSSYGPQFAYYLPSGASSGTWFPALENGTATWTPDTTTGTTGTATGTGTGTGAPTGGTLDYEIKKTLLSAFMP